MIAQARRGVPRRARPGHPAVRRRFGELSSVIVSLLLLAASPAGAEPSHPGCWIRQGTLVDSMDSARGAVQQIRVEDLPLVKSSGSRTFDRSMGRLLVMLSQDFQVSPGFSYYEDGKAFNALATPVVRVPQTTGTVLFGINFLNNLVEKTVRGDISVAAILAHEYGHIYQFQSGAMEQFEDEGRPQHFAELHADFMAGYFLGLMQSRRPDIRLRSVGILFEDLGSSEFSRESSHGTSRQRVAAIEAGYRYMQRHGEVPIDRVAGAGEETVAQLD